MTSASTGVGPHAMRRRRRVRWLVVGVTVLAVLGVGTAVALTRLGARSSAEPQGPAAAETAEVEQVDLADVRTVTGALGYGPEQTMTGKRPGTITRLPAQGAVLDRGAEIYEVDARPVVLFLGDLPLYRPVGPGVTDGPDVRLVEQNLRDLGYGGFGTPDEEFTSATEAAVKRWQDKLGVDETGVVALGDVLVTPGPVRVSTVTAELGGEGTGPVLDHTGTTRSVTAELDESQKALAAPGTKVTLTINGQEIPGTVTGVVPAPTDESRNPMDDQEPAFTATISVDDMAAIGSLDSGSVDVRLTADVRAGVLAVPVGALLALAEGGYGVEVVDGDSRRLVAVETGLFADGMVEVAGDGLTEGMTVVTTS